MKSEDIINKITQNDLFSSKKLLVIRNPGSLRNKARLDFLSYCKNPMINNCIKKALLVRALIINYFLCIIKH